MTQWLADWNATGEVHVTPIADLITHTDTDDCTCGPTTEPVPRQDGTTGWVVTHHSLDGREHTERNNQ